MHKPSPSVAQALRAAHPLPVLEAQWLLLHVLRTSAPPTSSGALTQATLNRAWLLAHDDHLLSDPQWAQFESLVQARLQGQPLAYVLGEKEFFGLTLHVDARVLDPRQDTEVLVRWALEVLTPPAQTVLDMGTGSGAIALALQHTRADVRVHALDVSEAALQVAQANAQRLRLPVQFWHGAWFEAIPTGQRFDVIVSNPPYIAQGDEHLPALRFEPELALVAGADGLRDLRHLIEHAPDFLQPGGWLLLEHGYDQAPAVRALLTQAGFEAVQSRQDDAGIERCSGGRIQAHA